MVAMTMIMPAMATLAGRRAAHGDAARFAELPVLRFHASRDPGHVGDDVGTKPHGIGRARLAGGIAALGGGAVETTKQQGKQDNGAGQMNDPHGYPLGLATFCAGEFADEIGCRLAQSKSRPGLDQVSIKPRSSLDCMDTCSPKGGESTISPATPNRVVFSRN
jgi:hypothetical protein